MKKRKNHEDNIHLAIANYIRAQYPGVLFLSDGAGVRVSSMRQAVQMAKLRNPSRGWPDLFIPKKNHRHGFGGLFLELKKDRSEVYTKSGKLRNNKHIQEQQLVLDKLWILGYQAQWGLGFDDARQKIDAYLRES